MEIEKIFQGNRRQRNTIYMMQRYEKQIKNKKQMIERNKQSINSLQQYIKYNQRVLIFINLQSEYSPLNSFQGYCQFLGIVHPRSDQSQNNKSETGIMTDFQMDPVDQQLMKQDIAYWNKSVIIQKRIAEIQKKCAQINDENAQHQEILQQLKENYEILLKDYQNSFEVKIKSIR